MKILIKNCFLYNCINMQKYDIITNNGVIAEIEPSGKINCDVDQTVNGEGLTAFPGLVDMHCHLREPGFEYKEDISSGTAAAAKGGFTSIACMPNTNPICDSEAVVKFIKDKARISGYAEVYPIAAITKGQKGAEIAEFGNLKAAGAIALSDDGNPVENPLVMKNAMLYAKSHDMLIISHCEDRQLANGGVVSEGYNATISGLKPVPKAAEEIMVAREAILASATGARVHIAHISTAGSIEIIRQAKKNGIKITCETCPHYFAGDDSMILGYDTNAKVNPPLRSKEDKEAIIKGLVDGTIDAIATDHAPHHFDDKNVEFDYAANGISGFETAFALGYTELVKTGHISLQTLMELMSFRPAEILKITNKGLNEGAAADIFLADLSNEYTINSAEFVSKGKNTPFNGKKVFGKILYTLKGGEIKVYKDQL
jgi:dihydroorotase